MGLLFVLIIAFFIFLEINLGPTIKVVAEAKTKLLATKIINEAVYTNVVNKITYQDLMIIHKDNQNRIVLMLPNTIKINQIAAETTLEIEEKLDELKSQGFSIPVGQISGSVLFANTGPPIKIGVIPVGTIEVDVIDEFIDAGINQTKHRIALDIRTNLRVVVPLFNSSVEIAMQVPVTESIIVGPVPEWYMNFNPMSNSTMPSIVVPGK